MSCRIWLIIGFWLLTSTLVKSQTASPTSPERGRKALLERNFNAVVWSNQAYENSWHQWQKGATVDRPPSPQVLKEHYGLHDAPYPNHGYPMGLRAGSTFLRTGLTTDCLLCHGGSIAGQSYVGLGNASLDMQALYEDLAAADGRSRRTPFTFSHVRGTTEAGAMAVFLLSHREPNLSLRFRALRLGLRDDLCEDVPAWWLLKKKKTMYHTGSSDARSVRSIMQFMLSPFNSAATIKAEEGTFTDIQAFILSLEAPKYPFAIDQSLARQGLDLFKNQCSRCHGTYGEKWTYPNKIVPINVVGTDRNRLDGFTEEAGRHYNRSWFAQEKSGWLVDDFVAKAAAGYLAPPLDGIWATAPYFHNGSVPNLMQVLNSKSRPRIYTRTFRSDKGDYDPLNVGWKIKILERGAEDNVSQYERRKIYDTTLPGRGNGGHTFGDELTEVERAAIVEYLKTL